MAKTRNSKIKPTSEKIIKHLKNKKSIKQIIKMGYPESTVKYYRRKLFNKEGYERFIKKIAEYNRAKGVKSY